MNKILLINGSPKGLNSNTRKLTEAFIKGLNQNNDYEIEEIICSHVNVKDCTGCLYCWKNAEGECFIKDDMSDIFQKYVSADIIIWSFPNYFYGIPAPAKRIMDRLLPLYYQNLATNDQRTTYHLRRYELGNKKYLLFCSCGLYNTENNIEGIKKQFELLYDGKCEMLFCSEGQLISNNFMDYRTSKYLKALEDEGIKYNNDGKLSRKIKEFFETQFLNIDDFLSFVDAASILRTKTMSDEEYTYLKIKSFFKNMSLTYDASKLEVNSSVLEIQIIDFPYTCQLHLNQVQCSFVEDKEQFIPYRLKVVSKFSFFKENPTIVETTNFKANGPDFNTLIELINKYEKAGKTKVLRFA